MSNVLLYAPPTHSPYSLKTALLTEPGARLAASKSQPSSGLCSPTPAPPHSHLNTGIQVHIATPVFLCGCRGFKPRSSGFHSRCPHPLSPLSSPEPLKFKEIYTGERVTQITTNDRGEVNLLLLPEIGLIPLVYWPFLPSNKKKPTSQLKNRPNIGRQLSKEYINGPQTYEKLLSPYS